MTGWKNIMPSKGTPPMVPRPVRLRLHLVLFSAVFIATTSPTTAKEKKVLILGYDGIRADAFQVADTPIFDALALNGMVTYDAQSEDNTISGCCWSSILLGVHRDRHGVDGNADYGVPATNNNLASWPDVFSRLEAYDPSLVTARFTRWTAMSQTPSTVDVNNMVRLPDGSYPTDIEVAADACLFLRGKHPTYSEDPDVLFVYHGDTDKVGHTYGFDPNVPEYIASIEQDDMLTARYLAALQSRPNYANEDWMIVICTDHGGLGTSHGAATQETRTVPLIVSGDSIVQSDAVFPQRRTVDVTATTLAYMGVPEADFADLDGRPFGLSAETMPQLALGTNLVFNGDGEFTRGFDDATPDQYISGWEDRDGDGMSVMRYDALSSLPASSPSDRGDNFFIGGIIGESTMSQTIDLREIGPLVESGRVAYDFSGWLGGWANQNDHADLILRFLDGERRRDFQCHPRGTLRRGEEQPDGPDRAIRQRDAPLGHPCRRSDAARAAREHFRRLRRIRGQYLPYFDDHRKARRPLGRFGRRERRPGYRPCELGPIGYPG